MKRKISLFLLMLVSIFTLVCANVKVSADEADETWKLVTDASTLKVGDQVVIVSSGYNFALSITQNGNNRAKTSITKSADKSTVTIDDKVQIITLEEGSKSGSFAFNVGNGYLYAASSSSNYLRTQTTKDNNSSWNITISSTGVATVKAQGNYTHNWLRYNNSNGIFSCYESGQLDIVLYRLVGEINYSKNVSDLFDEYYNNGTYVKESVLNVNNELIKDVNSYFHAGASVSYRKTIYQPGSITMFTKANLDDSYSEETLSKYEDKNGQVYHSGLNNPYYVNWENVEKKFITLDDFRNSKYTDWTASNSVYTYELVPTSSDGTEHDMTKWAREFVAPMWLAPTSKTYNYVIFDKLTVEVVDDALVMKLYVDAQNSGKLVDNAKLVFAQVTIKKAYTINVQEGENYSISQNQLLITTGETKQISLNVSDGYKLKDANVNNANRAILNNVITISNPTGNIFVIPEVVEDLKVMESVVSISTYANDHSWSNSVKYTEIIIDEDTKVTASGKDNTGKYYTSGTNWRIYASESGKITITSARIISKVVITYTTSENGTLKYNGGTVTSGSELSVDASSIELKADSTSGTKGQVRITKIKVIYAE